MPIDNIAHGLRSLEFELKAIAFGITISATIPESRQMALQTSTHTETSVRFDRLLHGSVPRQLCEETGRRNGEAASPCRTDDPQ